MMWNIVKIVLDYYDYVSFHSTTHHDAQDRSGSTIHSTAGEGNHDRDHAIGMIVVRMARLKMGNHIVDANKMVR